MQKVRTALLSYGMSGKVFHAPFLALHDGFELIGAWERTTKLIQSDFPDVKSYENLAALLSDDIDLVVVNTPVATHFEYAQKALLAGKHVLVEKAFTTTVAEAETLTALAKEKNRHISVFHNRRWDSDFCTVREIYDKGILGDLVEAEFHFDRYNPQLSPKKHKEVASNGAGILKDLGPHLIDQALFLFGMPNAVFADIRLTRQASLVDDYFDILLYYERFRVRLKAGFFVREGIPSYMLHGKMGAFLKPRGDVQEEKLKRGERPNRTTWGTESEMHHGLLHTEINGEVIRKKIPSHKGNYFVFFDGLYNAITQNTKVPVTAQDGSNVMRIIEAAIKSNDLQKVVIIKQA